MINQTQLVTNLATLLIFFALLFGFTKLLGPIPFDVRDPSLGGFTAYGEGKVNAKPDSATVNVGVLAKASTAEESQNMLNSKINRVIESIKGLGVPDEDIKTEGYNVYPEYGVTPIDAGGKNDQITGYTASSNISVNVGTSEAADKVVDTSTAAGANQVNGIHFELKDKEAVLSEARTIAVENTRKNAEAAAKAAGFRLGKVVAYSESESGGGFPGPYMARDAMGGAENSSTQTQPGENEVILTVNITYEIY